jgi:uncharacterized protein YbbC (DUF1343 family)
MLCKVTRCWAIFRTIAIAIVTVSFSVHAQQSKWSMVKSGIDNLLDLRLEPLRGKRIAFVCNDGSRTRFQRDVLNELTKNQNLELVAVLLAGPSSTKQSELSQPIPTYVLAAGNRRPTKAMLNGCDAVVIDLQDYGLRPTITLMTLFNVLDASAEFGIDVYVLDRPNPLGGVVVDGVLPTAQSERGGFTIVPIPYLHGMTIGELALMINSEGWLLPDPLTRQPRKCKLHVVKMRRWRRTMTWDTLQWDWVATSPNVPSSNALKGMALLGLLGELQAVSVGIGTEKPFQLIGAPDFSDDVIKSLQTFFAQYGIVTTKVSFVPEHGLYAGMFCRGICIEFPSNLQLPYYTLTIKLLDTLAVLYPSLRDSLLKPHYRHRLMQITGDSRFGITSFACEHTLEQRVALEEFCMRRQRYLLYP